ncbi:MAG: replication-relaxation family protein [Chloroflexi bacterium]|nr:replication-relaxation family protein [Chloroflexota bacterium]
MAATNPQAQASNGAAQAGADLDEAVRDYVRTYAVLHGKPKAAKALGVSRHTLWRFLHRGQAGRAIPRAVLERVGGSAEALEEAEERLILQAQARRRLKDGGTAASSVTASKRLSEALEDALRLLCAAPLATVDELARFGRVPASTLRARLGKLAKRGLVDSVPHHLSVLGSRPQRRYFPTKQGILTGGRIEHGTDHFLSEYPVSRQWFRLLAERMDAVAVHYRVAAMIADADPHEKPVRVDHYRSGPYDMLVTMSGGRSIGVIRQGATLPTSNLRYRLRSVERLPSRERPFATLVLTHADQATRRAIRSLSDPSEHRRTFAATEGELLAVAHTGAVWQQCGSGLGNDPPVRIDPSASLRSILAWMDRLLDSSHSFFRDNPRPDLEDLYSSRVKAAMPEPTKQITYSLAVQLTRAEKDALDLLAAWPLCTREQLAGFMGGVTLRRVNQVLRSLRERGLMREDGSLLMLTDEGLTYLARRDRAAVGLTLDRWSPEPTDANPPVYAGTALRALKSQLRHHAGVVGFASMLSAEVANSPDHDLFDLLPTHRSSIGYRHDQTTYAIHPDASFTLEYKGEWRPFLLEFERRATTPKRIPKRLRSYRRYFLSGWAKRDHEGHLPYVLFVFESHDNEAAFLDIADGEDDVPIITSNAEAIAEHGVLGDAWMLPPPYSLDRRPLALTYQVQQ